MRILFFRSSLLLLLVGLGTGAFPVSVWAATPVSLNATNPVFSDGIVVGKSIPNLTIKGISSFGGGPFIGSSTTNAGSGNIDTSGKAIGLQAAASPQGNSTSSEVLLVLNGNLSPGQSFGVDIDNGGSDANGYSFVNNDTGLSFSIGASVRASGGQYLFSDSLLTDIPTGADATQAYRLTYSLDSLGATYTLSLTPYGAGVPFTHVGVAPSFGINAFAVRNGADGTIIVPANDSFINNVNVQATPEPGALALMGIGSMLLLRRRR